MPLTCQKYLISSSIPPKHSSSFTVNNGCGQGKVLAAFSYCMCCEEFFETLRRRRSGCWGMGKFTGIFGYNDGNWLIAPSLPALQDMLETRQEYVTQHNIKFRTLRNARLSVWLNYIGRENCLVRCYIYEYQFKGNFLGAKAPLQIASVSL